MMESSRFEKDKRKIENIIIKYIRSLLRLKKETDDTTIKDVRNLFKLKKEIGNTTVKNIRNFLRLKKENKVIKNIIIRDIRNLFELEEENYYKPVRESIFWSNNYTEYESNGEKNKTLSVEEYLDKIRPFLKDIINNLKKSDTWKIELSIAVNCIYSKDNDEECVMHLKSDNIEIMINDKPEEAIEERFQSLRFRCQIGLETSLRGSNVIFNCDQLSYYKCHKINLNEVDYI